MPDTLTLTTAPNDTSYREIKARRIAGLLWLLVILQYGALSYFMLVVPTTTKIASGIAIDRAWGWGLAIHFGLLCLLVVFGAQRMRAILKVPDQLAAKQWTAGAATLALPSFYAYLLLMNKGRLMWIELNDQRLPPSSYMLFGYALVLLGFYMPFIFLTCWLNYRYRTDEF